MPTAIAASVRNFIIDQTPWLIFLRSAYEAGGSNAPTVVDPSRLPLLLRRFRLAYGGFQDQPGDLVRLGYQRQVTRLHFDGLGAHALGHEAFEIGIDRPVFRRNGIETRLRPPGRMRRLAREQSLVERLLDRIKDLRLRFRQVAGEIAQERSPAEASFLAGEDNPRGRR